MKNIEKAAKLLRDVAAKKDPVKMAQLIFDMDTNIFLQATEYNRKLKEEGHIE